MIYETVFRRSKDSATLNRMKLPSLRSFIIGALLLMVIDIPWLYINQTWAGSMIQTIQGSKITLRYFPALLVYLFMSYLLTFPTSYNEAFLMGACVYGVYDATNYATIKDYDPIFAVADTTWGGILLSSAWWIQKKYL